MHPALVYVELKTGYADNGPAWIGRAERSKSGKMLFFNGRALQRLTRRQNSETHIDPATGECFWVSGVKRDRTDRHWAGSGIILVDRAVVAEYLAHTGAARLERSRYQVVDFADNAAIRATAHAMENRRGNP